MIKYNYSKDYIELFYKTAHGEIIEFENWVSKMDNPVFFNVCNDLIVNGTATLIDSKRVIIDYEDISQLDSFEYETLGLPEQYPFEIFLDIKGSGLTDTKLKVCYYFQDFAHGNGSGKNLFFDKHRTGGYLKNQLEFLLSSKQYLLIRKIEQINESQFDDSTAILKEVSKIQQLAIEAHVVLSKTLHDTLVVVPSKVQFEISKIDDNKYKLSPTIEEVKTDAFKKSFNKFPLVKSNYRIREDEKSVRVVLNNEDNEDKENLKKQLEKLKAKNSFTGEELNEIYNNPTKFWNADFIDLDDFSKRVLELGIYKPRFYPFISPYKSQWIPGIVVEDRKEGTRHIPISNQEELDELKSLVSESKGEGRGYVTYKGENIDINSVDSIIDNAQKQIDNPDNPVTTAEEEEKKESGRKVLIIKENTLESEYLEEVALVDDVVYNFYEIDNLAEGVKLKDHQQTGVAWFQTLSREPHSVPGVLLADDMGLGKTLQVLYFIEWFSQNYEKKPVLVVAPVSLLENWQNEYRKFFPEATLDIVTLWGSNAKSLIIPNDKEKTIRNLSKPAIYFTTYETLRIQQIAMGLIDWGIVVLDEAQRVKTPGTMVTNAVKALKVDFKVAMTGTPVENSLMDLWCIIDFCSPGLLENARDFSSQYQKPLEDENTGIEELTSNLRKRIGATLMRRMKYDVAKDLPSIEYIKYKEEMPEVQYDTYINELNAIEKARHEEQTVNPVLQGIHNLRSISDHPYLKHHQVENFEVDKLINSSAKLKKVVEILVKIEAKEEKAIVFTQNKSMQRLLRKVISEKFNLSPAIINGDTPTSRSRQHSTKLSRQQEIDRYQDQEGFNVIIMSPIAAGFGLNITEANHVIHYTRHWNPAKEQQATDRAYRIGQDKPVTVYYPMAIAPENEFKTFDLVLNDLLKRKSKLASASLFPTERIEISRDDFMDSIDLKVGKDREIKIRTIEELEELKKLNFKAAIGILFEHIYGGDAKMTKMSNNMGVDVVFEGDDVNYIVQVKKGESFLKCSELKRMKYALPKYNDEYNLVFTPIVVTNGSITNEVADFAEQNDIELIDRNILNDWIMKNHITTNEIDRMLDSDFFERE